MIKPHTMEFLFPNPIAIYSLGFELTEKEKHFCATQERRANGPSNESSSKSYILKEKELKRLNNKIQECLKNYSTEVWLSDANVFVTQSWLNWTKPKQYHHLHNHPNSLYSGVFYINANGNKDKITFYQSVYRQLTPNYKEWNKWNSYSWWLPVSTGDIVIFPSSLSHMVEEVEGDDNNLERISLAFNSFATNFGSETAKTELKIFRSKET